MSIVFSNSNSIAHPLQSLLTPLLLLCVTVYHQVPLHAQTSTEHTATLEDSSTIRNTPAAGGAGAAYVMERLP